MISLWILAILVVFAVSLGHRAAINLKLSRYQRDRLKAHCLAMAGIQKSIVTLRNDNKDIDSFIDAWSTGLDSLGKPMFTDVELIPGSGEKFSVKYYNKDRGVYLCMSDEEAKINLNISPKELLSVLFQEFGIAVTDSLELAKHIQIWRGDTGLGLNQDASEYNDFKKKPFMTKEELLIVLEYFYQNTVTGSDYRKNAQTMYSKVKDLITCYSGGTGKININTASPQVIGLLIKYCIAKSGAPIETGTSGLLTQILESRDNRPFSTPVIGMVTMFKLTDPKQILTANELEELLDIKSYSFRIISAGEISATGIKRNIDCVLERGSEAFVYWHEN